MFQTIYNRDKFPDRFNEVNDLPSMTVPNDSMSVMEIIDRFSRGLPVTGRRVPVYNGDVDLPNTAKMDLADLEQLRRENSENLERLRGELNEKAAKLRQPKSDQEKSEQSESE